MPRKASSVMEERLRFQRSQLTVAPLCSGAHVRNQVTALFDDVVARIVGLACRLEPAALTDVRASWSGVSAECPSFKMRSRDPLMNVISGSSIGVDFFHLDRLCRDRRKYQRCFRTSSAYQRPCCCETAGRNGLECRFGAKLGPGSRGDF
jgi:hypothetical protein